MSHGQVLIRVRLSSGNSAIYDVQPCHLPSDEIPGSYHWPSQYGTQIAHEKDGIWFKVGGWEPITDPLTLTLIEKVAVFDKPVPHAGPPRYRTIGAFQ